jgi:hypothetical protein
VQLAATAAATELAWCHELAASSMQHGSYAATTAANTSQTVAQGLLQTMLLAVGFLSAAAAGYGYVLHQSSWYCLAQVLTVTTLNAASQPTCSSKKAKRCTSANCAVAQQQWQMPARPTASVLRLSWKTKSVAT